MENILRRFQVVPKKPVSFIFKLGLLWIFVAIFGTALWVAYSHYKGAVKDAIASNEVTANLVASVVFEHQEGAVRVILSYTKRLSLIEAVKKRDLQEIL